MTPRQFRALLTTQRRKRIVRDFEECLAAGMERHVAVRTVAARHQVTTRSVYRARQKLRQARPQGDGVVAAAD